MNQTEIKYGTKIANMSTMTNKGVKTCCKAITTNLFTVLGLLVWPNTSIAEPKGSIEEYITIRKTSIKVTYISPVIPPYLHSSFFYSSILRFNSISHQSRVWKQSTVESEVVNSVDLCGMISRTIKISPWQVQIVYP